MNKLPHGLSVRFLIRFIAQIHLIKSLKLSLKEADKKYEKLKAELEKTERLIEQQEL